MASRTPAKKSAKKPTAGGRAAAARAKAPARKAAAKAKPAPAKARAKAPAKKAKPKAKVARKPAPRAAAAKAPVKSAAKPSAKSAAKPSAKSAAKPQVKSQAKAPAAPAPKTPARAPGRAASVPSAPPPAPQPAREVKAAPKAASKAPAKPVQRGAAKVHPAPAHEPAPIQIALGPFRERLLRKREEIMALYRNDLRLGQEATDEPTEDIVDRANNSYSRELSFSISDAERNLLLQIDDAIRRLDGGSFGRCGHCSRPIAGLRLEALPWARLCIDCQELLEKGMLAEA